MGNEAIAATRIWTSGYHMYIASSTSGEAKAYSVAGQLVETVSYLAGKTATAILPRGVYIIKGSYGWVKEVFVQ